MTEIEESHEPETDEEAKERRREKRLLATHRRLLKNKDHYIPESVFSEKESVLRKTATRGVVKLFNAIRKHQKGDEPILSKNEKPNNSLVKSDNVIQTKGEKDEALAKKPSWDVLRSDYLMDTKTKNFWNEEAEFEDDHEYEEESD